MALMLCPSALSAPTLMGHFYAYNAILRSPHTMRRGDVVLAATPNQPSSGLRRRCSTATIDWRAAAGDKLLAAFMLLTSFIRYLWSCMLTALEITACIIAVGCCLSIFTWFSEKYNDEIEVAARNAKILTTMGNATDARQRRCNELWRKSTSLWSIVAELM